MKMSEEQLDIEDVMWNELLKNLREGVVSVLFEKANGTMREMVCTLNPIFISYEFKEDQTDKEPADTSESATVWDMEALGWRKLTKTKINTVTIMDCKIYEK